MTEIISSEKFYNSRVETVIKRKVEDRKTFLISKYAPKCNKILDLGCGSGVYFPALREKGNIIVGIDINSTLCRISSERGYIVVNADAERLPFKNKSFDCIWASEIIEHFFTLDIIDEIERIAISRILITMPNPISPHYKVPTHVLNYSVSSLKNTLNNKDREWNYDIRGLGYKKYLPQVLQKLSLNVTWCIPWIAPTIAVIGTKKE